MYLCGPGAWTRKAISNIQHKRSWPASGAGTRERHMGVWVFRDNGHWNYSLHSGNRNQAGDWGGTPLTKKINLKRLRKVLLIVAWEYCLLELVGPKSSLISRIWKKLTVCCMTGSAININSRSPNPYGIWAPKLQLKTV